MFGCLVTRNVNLELVQDKSAEQFLMSFQRHCAENGQPSWVLSDRASEYIKTKNELEDIINSDTVKKYMENKSIEWKLSPARSPKHNSTAESLIKVSKNALYGVFGNKKLTETEFSTAIKLAQNRMNSRPLIGLSDDPKDDNILTITPHHLKLGRPIAMLPSAADKKNESDVTDTKIAVFDRWTKRKLVQQQFYLKWQNEYLASLSKNKRVDNKDVKNGDVVLLLNERHSRETWPIARVVQVFKSKDGVVRSVECKMANAIKTKPDKKNAREKDQLSMSDSLKIKIRTTTRGVENIAILHSTPVNPEPSEKDVDFNPTTNTTDTDAQSSNLDD